MVDHVANEIILIWESEDIPDDAILYMRIHKNNLKSGHPIINNVFRLRPNEIGMSTDWDKYSTPQETRKRAKNPLDNAVIALSVGEVRRIPNQEVIHSPVHADLTAEPPILANRSHTDVTGIKDTEARLKFSRIYTMAVELDEPL
jgi:hypothetical protein